MTAPRISQNVTAEITRLEEELARLRLQISDPVVTGRKKLLRKFQNTIADTELRLNSLRSPGSTVPGITPASASITPIFAPSGPSLTGGLFGVDALKLVGNFGQVT